MSITVQSALLLLFLKYFFIIYNINKKTSLSLYSINVTDTVLCSTSGPQGGSFNHSNSRKESNNAEREFLQGATVADVAEGNEDIFGLSTDSLSHLRSPSVLEVREKGYERLKEELAKAQRVRLVVLSPALSLFTMILM